MLGFIFIDKKPIEEERIDKPEEEVPAVADDETLEEEELEVKTRLVKQETFNEAEIQIDEAEDDDEPGYDDPDDGSEPLQDDNENEEVLLPDDMEMIEEEYLNDSNAEIEKSKFYFCCKSRDYKILQLQMNQTKKPTKLNY